MLTVEDISRIGRHFAVYDHEWRAYAPVLGEPYLLNGCIGYFDGVILYVCAYPLGDSDGVVDADGVEAMVRSHPQFAGARAVMLWGRLESFSELVVSGESGLRRLERVTYSDYDPLSVDSVVDVRVSADDAQRRERRRRVSCSGMTTEVLQRPSLAAEHLALIDEWSRTKQVSAYHAALAAAVADYVGDSAIHLVEARLDGDLLGLGVLASSSSRRLVMLQNFNRRIPGMAVGDAIYAAATDFAKDRHADYLHFGYSATAGLLTFKRRWGASLDGKPYRDAGFTDDRELGSAMAAGLFSWQHRLVSRSMAESEAESVA